MDIGTLALISTAVGFVGCMVAIAVCDLGSFTIPNSISVALLWLFVVTIPLVPNEISLASHFCSFLVVLAAGVVAFRFGVFGGGDVKSWAAVALWYDLGDLPFQILSVTLVGTSLGLTVLALRRVLVCDLVQRRFPSARLPRVLQAGEPVPYGIAISLGSLMTISRIDLFPAI